MGKLANFTVVQWARLKFHRGTVGRAPILVQHSRQGLMWASQATYAMLHCLMDEIWKSFGATDVLNSMANGLGHPGQKNGYWGLRAVDPGAVGRG